MGLTEFYFKGAWKFFDSEHQICVPPQFRFHIGLDHGLPRFFGTLKDNKHIFVIFDILLTTAHGPVFSFFFSYLLSVTAIADAFRWPHDCFSLSEFPFDIARELINCVAILVVTPLLLSLLLSYKQLHEKHTSLCRE